MKRLLLFIFPFFISALAQGQAPPYSACFTADVTRGCAPLTINVTDCSGVKADQTLTDPFYYYENSGTSTTDTFYTYTTPGLYSVRQLVPTGLNNPRTDDTVIVDYIEVLPSPAPEFSVERCEGRFVRVNIEGSGYEEYEVDFGDGSSDIAMPDGTVSHNYTGNGPYTITVTGKYVPGNCGSSAQQSVTPYQTLTQPEILSLTNEDGEFRMNLNAREPLYIIQDSDTIFSANGSKSHSTYSWEPPVQDLQVRLVSSDNCSVSLTSPEVPSRTLSVSAENNQNSLQWNGLLSGTVEGHIIYKNGIATDTVSGSATTFTDNNIQCGEEYCYRVEAILIQKQINGDDITSVSNSECVTGISTTTPSALTDIEVSYSDNGTSVSWASAASAVEYQIYTTDNNTPEAETSETSALLNVQEEGSCYEVTYTDICGNTAPASNPVCPVFLRISEGEEETVLSWSDYKGENAPAGYRVVIRDQNGNITETIDAGLSNSVSIPVPDEGGTISYSVVAYSASGDINISNSVTIEYKMELHVPSAFTPNNDGVNDTFYPKGKFVNSFKMVILNRWGEVVYTTYDINDGWDGYYQHHPAPADAYSYIIEAVSSQGETRTLKGTVTLLK